MCRSPRADSPHYGKHDRTPREVLERSCTGKDLSTLIQMSVKQTFLQCRLRAMYLDHYHRKREHVRTLAMCHLRHDLWCGPSESDTTLM